jgi:hypothetical protein
MLCIVRLFLFNMYICAMSCCRVAVLCSYYVLSLYVLRHITQHVDVIEHKNKNKNKEEQDRIINRNS